MFPFYDGSRDFNSSTCDARSITCKKRVFIWLLELIVLITIFINYTLFCLMYVLVVSKRIWSFLNITGIITLPCLGVVLLPPDVRLQAPLQFSAELFSSSVTQSPCMKNRIQKSKYFWNYIEYIIKYGFITCLYNNFDPVTNKNIFEKNLV